MSDHFDGRRFFNPYQREERGFADVIRWQRTRQRSAWPKRVELATHPPPPSVVPGGSAAVTFIGHSTFLVRTASAAFLTDPVFTSHAGPFGRLGPRRVREPGLPIASVSSPDLVLVSHNHYDHLQPSSLRHFASATFVTALGLGSFLRGLGLERVIELDWWQKTEVGPLQIDAVPAQHFSARTPFDRNRTLWCGFVIRIDGLTLYYAGDTGYSPYFRQIADRCGAPDLALLPIGAYEPRWFMQPVHMNPEEAVRAHLDLAARQSLGMHFGTFQLTDEAIDEPLRGLERARAAANVEPAAFGVLDFGDTKSVTREEEDKRTRGTNRYEAKPPSGS